MRTSDVRIGDSPDHPGQARLSAIVHYENPSLPGPETYWFDVEQAFASDFSQRGSPWLTLLLPMALTYGESLELALPVDRKQYENALRLMEIWRAWYPELNLRPVQLLVEIDDATTAGDRRAAFFSGGIDTFFTVLQNPGLDDLIIIRGFDLPLQEDAVYEKVLRRLRDAASRLGKRLVPVRVNFRETAYRTVDAMKLSAGSSLASVALAMEQRWSSVFTSASLNRLSMKPFSLHPETDVLHSNASLEIVQYGAHETRFEKTLAIAKHPVVQKYIRVCWVDGQGGNCGRCNKCIRSMLAFQLAGVLPQIETFPRHHISVSEARKIYHPQSRQTHYFDELIEVARQYGQPELADALEYSLKRSARVNRWTHIEQLRALAERMKYLQPVLYRLLYPARRLVHHIGERFLGNLWT